MGITYKDAGVDKEEGYKSVSKITNDVKRTYNKRVLNNLGSFAALYDLGGYHHPVLVSGTDGIGTKIKIALDQKKYDTVGIDAVAMCVNDILCQGAKPLFFLDYLACGKLDSDIAKDLVHGMVEGCLLSGAALVGGEMAEMPGFYQNGEYDVAGFAVGVVEKSEIITGETIGEGDILIGLASSGVHSNGFSMIRHLCPDLSIDFEDKPLWQTLLEPTTIYVPYVLPLLKQFSIKGMAHITGGGLIENVPRMIPDGLMAHILKTDIPKLSIFTYLSKQGIDLDDMWETFNMGVGFVLAVSPADESEVLTALAKQNIAAFTIGKIVKGDRKICLE